MATKSLRQKLDLVFWWIIYLLPVIFYLVEIWRTGSMLSFMDFFKQAGWMNNNVTSTINKVWAQVGFFHYGQFVLNYYISYLIGVEVCHCFYDVLVFIPRFCHRIIDRSEKLCGKD